MRDSELKKTLDELVSRYGPSYLEMDPLEQVKRFDDAADQEIAGFIAAMLALGRYELIRRTVDDVLAVMGDSPFRFVSEFHPHKTGNPFEGIAYRFYKSRDIGLLVWWLAQMVQTSGSVQAFFLEGCAGGSGETGEALSAFIRRIQTLDTRPFYETLPPKGRGASHFLTDPVSGSACKRLNLFLRWMVRTGWPDLGLWRALSPARLIIPLDTHISRFGKKLGWTRRSHAGWSMALDITRKLREFDSEDPVKYDFALCTLGKLMACPTGENRQTCDDCPVSSFCTDR